MSTQQLQWQYVPGRQLALSIGDSPLWTYYFNTERHKAFFHPLRTLDGTELTAFEPSDHVWHRGLWFSWKYLNGVNYWEENENGSDGVTRFVDETLNFGSTWLNSRRDMITYLRAEKPFLMRHESSLFIDLNLTTIALIGTCSGQRAPMLFSTALQSMKKRRGVVTQVYRGVRLVH